MNTDRRISAKEMQHWIMQKTAEHFQEAVKENKLHFRAVDPDGDGTVGRVAELGEVGGVGKDTPALWEGPEDVPRLRDRRVEILKA